MSEDDYAAIVKNRKFAVHVLDPKDDRRDNIRVTLYSDDGEHAHHHLRTVDRPGLPSA